MKSTSVDNPVPKLKIYPCCRLDSALDAMECTMRWSHIAPTCPDTLGCFPYTDSDPFIIKSRPHVNFVGNQKFGQR